MRAFVTVIVPVAKFQSPPPSLAAALRMNAPLVTVTVPLLVT
jgi:hypothetical protein